MTSKNFLLVSLEESKAKELAQIVTNDICRKILDYLTSKEKGATETDISKDLQIPLSTVHYNLKQLLKSGIVKAEEFHYSAKGKEVLHYSLANKYIIIAPKAMNTESLANKLKRILPAVIVVAAAGAVLQAVEMLKQGGRSLISEAHIPMQKATDVSMPMAQEISREAISTGSAAYSNQTATVVVEKIITQTIQPNIALWFIAGAAVAILAMLAVDAIRNRKQ